MLENLEWRRRSGVPVLVRDFALGLVKGKALEGEDRPYHVLAH